MSAAAFPLTWPASFPRRVQPRENGSFKTSISKALNNVQDSLRRFGSDSGKKVEWVVISSNVTLGVQNPPDPGVAVWFTWDGLGVCIAVDRYSRVESNLQAIHHIIEARRTELRHGTLALVRATFSGFKSLPAPASSEWWKVLGVAKDATMPVVEAAYRKLRSEHHPDKGGAVGEFDKIQSAYAHWLGVRTQ